MAGGVPPNRPVDLIVYTEHLPRDGRAGLSVKQLQRLLLQLVQLDAVLTAQGQLLRHIQLLRAVVEQRRYTGLLHIRAVAGR